jgi:uncharacterized Tic20 family protein
MSNIGPGPEENRTSRVTESAQPAAPVRDRETNQWAMFIHFSILAGWVVPIGGLIVPIILWQESSGNTLERLLKYLSRH